MQPDRVRRDRHYDEPAGIEQCADSQYAPGTEFIGYDTKQGLPHTPAKILQRHRQAEGRPIPAVILQYRQLEKPHRRTRAEGEQRDDTGAGNRYNRHRLPDEGLAGHKSQFAERARAVYNIESAMHPVFPIPCGTLR